MGADGKGREFLAMTDWVDSPQRGINSPETTTVM